MSRLPLFQVPFSPYVPDGDRGGAPAGTDRRQKESRPATGEPGREAWDFLWLRGLPEQVGEFGLDVDVVALLADWDDLVRPAEEL